MYMEIRRLLSAYTPDVVGKSIDEFVLDLAGCPDYERGMETVAMEIKERHRQLYDFATINIGIAPNRFLAKTAAGLHKPDGLDRIDWRNLEEVYSRLELTDLCGIAERNEARLRLHGIRTPLDFLNAPEELLRKHVFGSVNGTHWYRRLWGYEVDHVLWDVNSCGQGYSLRRRTTDDGLIAKITMKLCARMGRKMRRFGLCARAVRVGITYRGYRYWEAAGEAGPPMYTDADLFRGIRRLMEGRPTLFPVAKLCVSCERLVPSDARQLELFDTGRDRHWRASDAMDAINANFGDFSIYYAAMAGIEDMVIDRISFGSVREFEAMYG